MELIEASYLIIAPPLEQDYPSFVTLSGEGRRSLIAPAPAEFRYRVTVPPRAVMTFAIGMALAPGRSNDEALPGSRMKFTVRAGEDIPDNVVFEREIHVARRDQWIEQTVDLSAWSGRAVNLVFQTSFPGAEGDELAALVGVFAEPVIHDRARYRKSRGVVVISIDTLRRDHVSLYGYPRRTTPGLERLAEDAVVFDDAVSTSSWTLPAHASLFTSQYPSVHGAVNMDVGLSPSWPSLPQLFQGEGFVTQAFVTHTYLARDYGFAEGFDRHRYLEQSRAEEVTDRAIEFLSAFGDQDFFLFVHYYDPHWHYDPPPPFDTMFDAKYEGEASGIWWDFKEQRADSIDAADYRHILALYDGEIRYTDEHVERLLQEMKRLGNYGDSLIVVTSDHGEEFLEHGSWEHQKTLYDEQLRVPLVIKYPGNVAGGTTVEDQVSLIDVAPTILSALSLPAPGGLSGRDLRDGSATRREVWSETEHTLDGSQKYSLRLGARGRKAIFTRRAEALEIDLFQLKDDPGELTPMSDEEARRAFASQLEAFLDDAVEAREGVGASPAVELDEDQLERLRALGYVR